MGLAGLPAAEFSLVWDGAGGNADTMACYDLGTDDAILSCSYEFNLQSSTCRPCCYGRRP